ERMAMARMGDAIDEALAGAPARRVVDGLLGPRTEALLTRGSCQYKLMEKGPHGMYTYPHCNKPAIGHAGPFPHAVNHWEREQLIPVCKEHAGFYASGGVRFHPHEG